MRKNRTLSLVKDGATWKIWNYEPSEADVAAKIFEAKSEEERDAILRRDPSLITSDLANLLARRAYLAQSEQGRYQEAITIHWLAYRIAEQLNDRALMAGQLINLGSVYGAGENPDRAPGRALECYQNSLSILNHLDGNLKMTSIALVGAAIIYQVLGDYPQAIGRYLDGIKAAEEANDKKLAAQGLNNLGVIYQLQGNYSRALEVLLRSLALSEADPNRNATSIAYTLGNIGDIFYRQADADRALGYYQKSLDAAKRGVEAGEADAQGDLAIALSSIGDVHRLRGDFVTALAYYQESLSASAGLGQEALGGRERFLAQVQCNIAHIWKARSNFALAATYYREALRLAENAGDHALVCLAMISLGNLAFSDGRLAESLALAKDACRIAEKALLYPALCQALVAVANAYRDLGEMENARQALMKAIGIAETLRSQHTGNEFDGQRNFESVVFPYQAMVALEISQHRYAEAFSYAQQAKGRALLDVLRHGRMDITKSMSQAEREQEQTLNQRVVFLNTQVIEEKQRPKASPGRIEELERKLKAARLEFELFQATLYASHPELRRQRGELRPFAIADAAEMVRGANTALLDFVVTEKNSYLFVLTRGLSAPVSLQTYTLNIGREMLAERVERFRRRLANRDVEYAALSRELYDLLLKPARLQLQQVSNLIIVPDGALWDLPFQVLQTGGRRYLLEDVAISYSPSLSVLTEVRRLGERKKAFGKGRVLALGDPLVESRGADLAKFILMDAELSPLPDAKRQVQALRLLYGRQASDVRIGPEAREDVVKRDAAKYQVLHFATHGILNNLSPMYSQVILSAGSKEEDGLLEAWEIMNMDLNAELVVLSACETARGHVSAGEGVVGFTWALLVAGCSTTVVSQWKVEASSTTELMIEFHRQYKTRFQQGQRGVFSAEAMRRAALRLMRNPKYRHPFYWGGFVVVGDGR